MKRSTSAVVGVVTLLTLLAAPFPAAAAPASVGTAEPHTIELSTQPPAVITTSRSVVPAMGYR